jgi:hypothetical protein
MLGVTALGLLFTPAFYTVVRRDRSQKGDGRKLERLHT